MFQQFPIMLGFRQLDYMNSSTQPALITGEQSMLEMASGEAATLKVRINDLSSHHQNQRFILVAGPADAPIRGSRSVPIEIMSKPRLEDKVKEEKERRMLLKEAREELEKMEAE